MYWMTWMVEADAKSAKPVLAKQPLPLFCPRKNLLTITIKRSGTGVNGRHQCVGGQWIRHNSFRKIVNLFDGLFLFPPSEFSQSRAVVDRCWEIQILKIMKTDPLAAWPTFPIDSSRRKVLEVKRGRRDGGWGGGGYPEAAGWGLKSFFSLLVISLITYLAHS